MKLEAETGDLSLERVVEQTLGKARLLDADEGTVVVVDIDLKEQGIMPLREAVQLHPPGWPAEAIEPWMARDEAAREPLAEAMIDPQEWGEIEKNVSQ